jgi:cytochrome c553
MTARLVLFIVFVLLTGTIIATGKYKTFFNSTRDLSYRAFTANQAAKVKLAKEKAAAKTAVVAVFTGPDLTNPLVKKGHDIYTQAGQCIKCHGVNGEGNQDEQAPMIAAQYDWYVLDQLNYMKNGARVNKKMMPYLKDLDSSDFRALAAYIKELRVK